MTSSTFLVTGASDGIGALYADRLARRGHALVLVARRLDKLEAIAARLRAEHGLRVDAISADLGRPEDLARVEARLRTDQSIIGLVNNAGIAGDGPIAGSDPEGLSRLIAVNVLATVRLTAAVASRFPERGAGTIINIGSVTSLMPAAFSPVYPATKAFVLTFSEGLQAELGSKGVRVQAVLPGITRTGMWSDATLEDVPPGMVMDAAAMVDAALAGLDLGETITIPSLPEKAALDAYLASREAMRPGLSLDKPAARYRQPNSGS